MIDIACTIFYYICCTVLLSLHEIVADIKLACIVHHLQLFPVEDVMTSTATSLTLAIHSCRGEIPCDTQREKRERD